MQNKKKLLAIMWTVRDFWSILQAYDKIYDARYISLYKPWLRWQLSPDKIILFNERQLSAIFWPFKYIWRNIRFLYHIWAIKPDIVITHHDDAGISIIPTLLLCKLLRKKIKFVAYMHAWISQYNNKDFFTKVVNFTIKFFYKRFDKIITVSSHNKQNLQHRFGLRNVEYLYNPIEISKSIKESKIPQRLIKADKNFKFIHIWRLSNEKWQSFLIKAFARVVKIYKDAQLFIIWDWPLKPKLEKLIKELKLTKNIKLLWLQDNVFNLIKACDALILTSKYESFGKVLVEGLLLDKIVISTDCWWPRELLAPELKVNQKIDFPYFGKYWILIQNFERPQNFDDIQNLNLQEKKLAAVMIKTIENKTKLKKFYNNWHKKVSEFEFWNYVKSLEKLI